MSVRALAVRGYVHRRARSAVLAGAAAALCSLAAGAQVAGGGDLQRFHPASTPWSGLVNGSSDLLAPGDWILGLHFDYAKNPLVLRRNGTRESAGVSDRVGLERLGEWLTVQAAAGLGILSAPGTPDWRGVFGVYTGHGRPRSTGSCVLHDPTGNQTVRKTGKDSDHDGIDDACDLCPFAQGVAPDGCPEAARCTPVVRPVVQARLPEPKLLARRKVVVQPVEFAFDSDVLRETSLPLITLMVEELKQLPDAMVCWVRGHTDARGTVEYNVELSQRRTEAVVREMIKQGVDPKRLYAQGFGQTRPIAPNNTDEGRQKNRRVEFVFTLPGDVDPGAKGGSAP